MNVYVEVMLRVKGVPCGMLSLVMCSAHSLLCNEFYSFLPPPDEAVLGMFVWVGGCIQHERQKEHDLH